MFRILFDILVNRVADSGWKKREFNGNINRENGTIWKYISTENTIISNYLLNLFNYFSSLMWNCDGWELMKRLFWIPMLSVEHNYSANVWQNCNQHFVVYFLNWTELLSDSQVRRNYLERFITLPAQKTVFCVFCRGWCFAWQW